MQFGLELSLKLSISRGKYYGRSYQLHSTLPMDKM
jgi:hypothetical protein